MKIDVDDKVWMARIAEQGNRDEDMVDFTIEMFRMKDKQKVKLDGKAQP